VEAYDAATAELAQIRAEQTLNSKHLVLARHNLRAANRTLASRMRAVYTGDSQENSTLAIMLGATSLSDFINKVDTANRVADEDSQVINEINRFHHEVIHRGALLRRAHVRQVSVVSRRAAARRQIEGGLAERQSLLSQIKGEIAHLQA